MSPEQARGETAGQPSDVFSLGLVFYELAAGRYPFQAESAVAYLHAITYQTLPPLIGLPEALGDLIGRMLSKDPAQRPTARQVAEAIGAIERADVPDRPAVVQTKPSRDGFWIAVLPFQSTGTDPCAAALAEGLFEEILTGLSRFSYLNVIARASTRGLTHQTGDLRSVGHQLGARYLIEGSVRQAGARLRLTVQVSDSRSGAQLWTETYDRSFAPDKIFELQDDLAPRMVSTIADAYGVLVRNMGDELRDQPDDQFSPHEAVLLAHSFAYRLTPDMHLRARKVLEQAVHVEPGNADCWSCLATVYAMEHANGFNPLPDSLGRAMDAARRAVDLAPANAGAHLAVASVYFFLKKYRFPRLRDSCDGAQSLRWSYPRRHRPVLGTRAELGGWQRTRLAGATIESAAPRLVLLR